MAQTAALVACEPWALPLVAIALFGWLEETVGGVARTFGPLALALAATAGLALAGLPGAPLAGAGALAAYSLAAYGRRGLAGPALALVGAAAHLRAGAGLELLAGGLAGAALGLAAWAGARKVFPGGHLARRPRAGAP